MKTARLSLFPLCMDNLQEVHSWQSDPATMKYINPPHTEISQTVEYLEWVTGQWQKEHQTYYSYGIALNDVLIGEIGFSFGCGKCGRCIKGEAAIGYTIHQKFSGYGYEQEAIEAIIAHCFSVLNADKIKMSCDTESIAELQVIQRLGMQLIQDNEDCEYNDGKPFKRNIYVLNNPNLQ